MNCLPLLTTVLAPEAMPLMTVPAKPSHASEAISPRIGVLVMKPPEMASSAILHAVSAVMPTSISLAMPSLISPSAKAL
jgi:hypothetical protein